MFCFSGMVSYGLSGKEREPEKRAERKQGSITGLESRDTGRGREDWRKAARLYESRGPYEARKRLRTRYFR